MKDPEARRAYMQAYREKNREKLRAQKREAGAKHYLANKKRYKAKSRRWREANPERMQELQRQHRERNADVLRERSRVWYLNNKERASATGRRLKLKKYGLTEESYQALLRAQEGRCAICATDQPLRCRSLLYVDHCHTTGTVRGLLCHPCNAAIGLLKDDPALLAKAAAYLTSSSSGAT